MEDGRYASRLPREFVNLVLVGLLTLGHPYPDLLVAKGDNGRQNGCGLGPITAAGTVPGLHRIPFYVGP